MPSTREVAARRLSEWLRDLEKFDLPDWEDLPQLDLYMDQVILLLNRYLSPLERGEDKAVTASIINNYVRMKIMPPPVKKRYSRVHLSYLIIICTLKQSLSISCIQRLLPEEYGEEEAQALYEGFVRQFRTSVGFLRALPLERGTLSVEGGARLPLEGGDSLVATSAILTTLSTLLTEYLLQEDGDAAPDPGEDDEDE